MPIKDAVGLLKAKHTVYVHPSIIDNQTDSAPYQIAMEQYEDMNVENLQNQIL